MGFLRRHPAWSWIGLVLFFTAILVLVYLPRAIEWGLERWLKQQGRVAVDIEDVDFSPFTGRLVLHALLAEREGGPGRLRSERLALNVEWWPLTRKRLLFEQITVRDALITVRKAGGTWFIGGLRIDTGEEVGKAGSAWRFGFDGVDLSNVTVVYLEGDLRQEVTIEEAHLDAMAAWESEQMAEFRLRLRAAGAALTLTGRARPFAEQPVLEGRLETAGFPLSSLQPWLAGTEVEIAQGQLTAAVDLSGRLMPEEGRLRLSLNGSAELAGMQADLPGLRLEQAALSWQGQLELAAPRQNQPPLLTATGTVTSPGLTLLLETPPLRTSVGQLALQAEYLMGTPEVPAGADYLLRLQGSAGPLQAFDTRQELTLAAVQNLRLDGIRLAGNELAAQTLAASGLRFLQRPTADDETAAHYLTLQTLALENAAATRSGPVSVGAVRLQGLEGRVVRNEAGDLDLSPWSFAPDDTAAAAGAGDQEEGETEFPAVRVGLVELAGDNRLRYLDRSVDPDAAVTLAPLQFRMENFDTAPAADAAPSPFRLQLQANGHPLALQGTARLFGDELTLASDIEMKSWPLRLLDPYLGAKVQVRKGVLTVSGKGNVNFVPASDRLAGELNGKVRLAGVSGDFGDTGLVDSTATLNGTIRFVSSAEAAPAVELDGNLQIPTLTLTFAGSPLTLEGQQGRLQGRFAIGTAAVPAGAEFLATVSGSTGLLRIADRQRNRELFAAEAVAAEKLRVTGAQTIRAASLDIRAPRALERKSVAAGEELSHLFAAASFRASDLQIAEPNRLQATELRLQGVQAMVALNAEGEFDFAAWPEGARDEAPPAQAAPAAEPPWQVQAERVTIDGESRLLFRDLSVDPAVRLEVQPLSLRAEKVNTAAATPSPFRLEGRIGRYAPLRIEGTLTAIGPPPSLAGTAAVDGFNLQKITGYIEKYAGHTVRSGQLDLELEGKIVKGQVQAEATMLLTQLNLEPLRTQERAETERQLGFPLNTGLNLLRDKQGTIALDFPIRGDIRSPEVGLAGIIQTAVFKAMRGATFSYLANLGATALGAPTGASFLARRIFDRFTAVRFRPVAFAAGVADIDPASRAYLNEIAAKLEDRGEINIVLCGVATPADAAALPPSATEAELRQLAQQRSERVKEALVERGIAAGRLVLCAPEILAEEGDGGPRVEVGI